MFCFNIGELLNSTCFLETHSKRRLVSNHFRITSFLGLDTFPNHFAASCGKIISTSYSQNPGKQSLVQVGLQQVSNHFVGHKNNDKMVFGIETNI